MKTQVSRPCAVIEGRCVSKKSSPLAPLSAVARCGEVSARSAIGRSLVALAARFETWTTTAEPEPEPPVSTVTRSTRIVGSGRVTVVRSSAARSRALLSCSRVASCCVVAQPAQEQDAEAGRGSRRSSRR